MTGQLPLNLARSADQNCAAKFRPLVMDLLGDGKWRRAKSICADLDGLNDRALRQIAEESDGEIISGQQGYKLTRHATKLEMDKSEAWMLSQIKHMGRRVMKQRKARNRWDIAA